MDISKQTEQNIKILVAIRDDMETSPAVRIQAIQTMQKIMDAIGTNNPDGMPTEEDIISKIRGAKK